MKITEIFRDQILFAMPELSQADANKIADIEGCSAVTVYNHWKKLKDCSGEITPIMMSLAQLATSYKKKAERDHKRMLKIQQQLSAA